MSQTVLFCIILIGISHTSLAQGDIFGIDTKARNPKSSSAIGNFTRNVLSSISFNVSAGMSYHTYQMDFLSNNVSSYPISYLSADGAGLPFEPEGATSFKGSDFAVPINAGVTIDLFGFATIGGGYGREFGRIGPADFQDYSFAFEGGAYTFDKLYGSFGLILYDARRRAKVLNWQYRNYSGNNTYMQAEKKLRLRQNYPWRFILEGEAGKILIRNSFDFHLTSDEPFYGIGLKIERELSEYAKVYLKPNFERRTFGYDRPDLPELQVMNQHLFTLNAGFSIRMPGNKRCKVAGCGVKMRHIHDGVEYRGSSIWNMQNRKVGQW
ncbi:hypothetical protein EL17_07555 [Anditalea andensis]|uniref:Uncharacterized protein n=1 Tax=Anditalea andensis TaxID=1048983 RepID=A0A074L2A0_9BACT|nr:hypothetical protein EL17_07555 [Anditalea andensis]